MREGTNTLQKATRMFELLKSAETLYAMADPAKKRQLLEIMISNCTASGKSLAFAMHEPFATAARRNLVESGGPLYYTDRTFLIRALMPWRSDA